MGQHTWFYKDRELYQKRSQLYDKLEDYINGNIWLEENETFQIECEIEQIDNLIESNYHDIFRTNKRNEDGTYIDDTIYSKEECNKWLEENKQFVQGNLYMTDSGQKEYPIDYKRLEEFWKEYPNGVIDFG